MQLRPPTSVGTAAVIHFCNILSDLSPKTHRHLHCSLVEWCRHTLSLVSLRQLLDVWLCCWVRYTLHVNLHRISSHYLSLEQLLERLASQCGASDRCALLSGGLAHGRQAHLTLAYGEMSSLLLLARSALVTWHHHNTLIAISNLATLFARRLMTS